jgi:hypothetical protein
MVRPSDWFEAIEINDQNGRSFGRFGRMVRFRQHLREPFVEHQAVAELGEGVDALLGRSFAHVVGADQPPAIHRYGLDPERAAIRKGDLAIALAVVGAGFAVDAIEQFRVAEQFFEDQIWLQQFSVGPNDRNGPVHAHECPERQLGHATGTTIRIGALPVLRRTGGVDR